MKDIKHDEITLCNNGKLKYNNTIYDMHTLSAIIRNTKAKRLNGFDYWHVKRNDKFVPIKQIREDYRTWKTTQTATREQS